MLPMVPHAPAAQAHDLSGPKAQPESVSGKTQQTKGQSPQQGCSRDDAQDKPPQKQRYDDGVHGHDSIPRSPGPVKRFSAGKAPCLAGRLPPACTTWTTFSRSHYRLSRMTPKSPAPRVKEAGLLFFFPPRALPRSAGTRARPLRCPELRPSRRRYAGSGQDTLCSCLPAAGGASPSGSAPPAIRGRNMSTAPCRRSLSGPPPPG